MDPTTKDYIDNAIANAVAFATKKVGDTPTDDIQLTNKRYVDSRKTYGGYVSDGGGAGTFFPSGWSVIKNSTGSYTVTHNLGTTNYAVMANAVATGTTGNPLLDTCWGIMSVFDANTFTMTFVLNDGSARFINTYFMFLLTL